MAGKGGRVPLLEDETVRSEILKAVSEGCSLTHACGRLGIDTSTIRHWRRKARLKKPKPIYVTFVTDLKKAECEAVKKHLDVITAASAKSWQAAAWWLERLHSEHFAEDKAEIRRLLREVAALEKKLTEAGL